MTFYYYFFVVVNTCVHPQVLHCLHYWQHRSDLVTAEEGGSQPGAVMIAVTIPFCPQLWGLLGWGLMNSLLQVPLSAWAFLSTHSACLTVEAINMPPGWHMNRSWLHRKESLCQASPLMWTQGLVEAREGRDKPGGGGGLCKTRSLQLRAAGPHVQTHSARCSQHVAKTCKENLDPKANANQ